MYKSLFGTKRIYIFILTLFLIATGVYFVRAQTDAVQIKGVVKNKADGKVLPGVNVVVKGTTFGTATDMKGEYSLFIPVGPATFE